MPTFVDIRRPTWIAALAAASLPSLLAFNVAPSPTFLNQALAFGAWGAFAGLLAAEPGLKALGWRELGQARAVFGALGVVGIAAAWSWLGGALPSSLALSAIGTLLAAIVLVATGVASARGPAAGAVFAAFCAGWVLAGVLNAGIAAVQVFAPAWPDGGWIARSSIAGRAVGNLRQPNHLSSLLLWAAISVVGCAELRRIGHRSAAALMGVLVLAVVLTASRTGVVGVVLLALWAVVDRRLAAPTRWLLLATPLLYAAGWLGMSFWASAADAAFGGQQRLAEADLSASRFGIWADTLTLIRRHPWAGVGFGEFNLAWSLSDMPHRPTAFFDHSHNLLLELAVELGLPLAVLVVGALLLALWQAARRAAAAQGDASVAARCAVAMLVLIGLHSLLEYPLWYSYFLLPAGWAFGLALGAPAPSAAAAEQPAPPAGPGRAWLAGAAALVVVGAAAAVADYGRVVAIFSSGAGAPPLQERIASGQRSILFSHHADYAAATVTDDPARELAAFGRAAHYLLDTRLMMAWATAFAEAGDLARAQHLAQRLREFRNPQSADLLAECAVPREAGRPPPFQCVPPARRLGWRDFLAP